MDPRTNAHLNPNLARHLDPDLDPHRAAPEDLKDVFKKYKRMAYEDIQKDKKIIDFSKIGMKGLQSIPKDHLRGLFECFLNTEMDENDKLFNSAYMSDIIPGLVVIPHLIPDSVQRTLVHKLLNEDLPQPCHKTNLSAHYNFKWPEVENLFSADQTQVVAFPIDENVHKPLTLGQVLDTKLRWMTLGAQYDWTNKIYPNGKPPEFPSDIGDLVEGLFPGTNPQAAIVNFYSPGSTLGMHRDVSEEVDRGLVSISIGCDCIFVIGLAGKMLGEPSRYIVLRLHSGDAIYMMGESRWAWHGVPNIISPYDKFDTIRKWSYSERRRININIRQIHPSTHRVGETSSGSWGSSLPSWGSSNP